MLKSINPILSGTLLAILADMGHGSEVAIVDANFPAADIARRHVDVPAVSADKLLDAVLSVYPLDDFVAAPLAVMVAPPETRPLYNSFQAIANKAEARSIAIEEIEPAAFIERARKAYAVILSGERQPYGSIILRKGVIRP